MTTLELWSVGLGLLLPLPVAVFQPIAGSSARRALIGLAVAVFVSMAVVTVYGHGWSVRLQLSSLLPMLVTMWASYAGFWRELGIPQAIELFREGLLAPPPDADEQVSQAHSTQPTDRRLSSAPEPADRAQ